MPGDAGGWDGAAVMGENLIMDFCGSFPKLKSFEDGGGRGIEWDGGGRDLFPERWRPLGQVK